MTLKKVILIIAAVAVVVCIYTVIAFLVTVNQSAPVIQPLTTASETRSNGKKDTLMLHKEDFVLYCEDSIYRGPLAELYAGKYNEPLAKCNSLLIIPEKTVSHVSMVNVLDCISVSGLTDYKIADPQ